MTEPPNVVGKCLVKDTGTFVRAWPNPKYFDSPNISKPTLEHLLRSKAMLLPGVNIIFNVETASGYDTKQWQFADGIADYIKDMTAEQSPVADMFQSKRFLQEDTESFSQGEGVECALIWTESSGKGESYVNLVPTKLGGTHESGLRDVAYNCIKTFAETHGLNHKSIKLSPEDVWSNLNYVIAIKMLDPAFSGQTKEKLSSREALKLVTISIKDQFDIWLNNNVHHATAITQLCVSNAITRTKSTKQVERKKTSGIAVLPGKLTDAEVIGIGAELYLVEGDSAGGSAKQARDKTNQGILALKGKSLNTWEVDRSEILSNTEVLSIASSIGVDPHGLEDDVDLSGLRYEKIITLADADVDGSHIVALILTLFMKHFPKLIKNGHIYIAHPPLYIINVQAHGKNPSRQLYASDNAELETIVSKLVAQNISKEKFTVSYLKGLGEMDPINLYESTLNPSTRKLSQLVVSDWDDAVNTFDIMMSDKNAHLRKELIANYIPI